MGTTRSCDKHPTDDNLTEFENIRNVVFQEWRSIEGKRYLFENKTDYCLQCRNEELEKIKVHRKDLNNNWKTTVWKTGKGGKRYSVELTPDEFMQHLKEEQIKAKEEALEARLKGTK